MESIPAPAARNVAGFDVALTLTGWATRFYRMQSGRYTDEPQQERRSHVRMGEDRRGRQALVFSFPFDELLNNVVKRLPGRWFNWETREWTVLCRPESAEEIAEMLACFPRVEVDDEVADWLADAAGWPGVAAGWGTRGGARASFALVE